MLDPWQRLEQDGLPIYINPEKPDWLVAGPGADLLLRRLPAASGPESAAGCGDQPTGLAPAEEQCAVGRLLARLGQEKPAPYPGRHDLLTLQGLKECWFHLTDRCNLACRHCLFGSSPGRKASLARETLLRALAEAGEAGCRLFYFTGGEPFVYPDFSAILTGLLAGPDSHAVVLSNGMLIADHLAELKKLPRERLHLQISMDGLGKRHDALRGAGAFAGLLVNLRLLREAGFAVTLSVAVNRGNVAELAEIVRCAGDIGVSNIHFLWHFVRGKGSRKQFVPALAILPELLRAQEAARQCGVLIDNVETLRGQVFGTPGTRYDLSNTAWESVAVGPDGCVYPSPALVGLAELNCGPLTSGLETIWRESPVLARIRRASLAASPEYMANPLKFLVGGGDIDHSYLAGGDFVGYDPYVPLYNGLALWLIAQQARQYTDRSRSDLLLGMGDLRCDCPETGQGVALTHCNCVISLSRDLGHDSVREFYGRAAVTAREDIANPFAPEQALASFIPEETKKKSYGCGSPVRDAAPQAGEVLVDLGSGSGVECFLAAARVGPSGRVFGIDMTGEMLSLAQKGKEAVVAGLGYDNVEFRKGFLEAIPLAEGCADVVISNCVINLSPDKRRTFHEIFRILKPGGRLVVSDIVSDGPVPLAIKNSERFRGECLGGALGQEDLLAMLRTAGFAGARLLKRFPYRLEGGTQFYSLTFSAWKPEPVRELSVIYRGPFAAVLSESGILLRKGQRARLPLPEAAALDDSLFVLDQSGAVINPAMENGCCAPSPTAASAPSEASAPEARCCGSDALPVAGTEPCGCGPRESPAAKIVALPSRPGVAESGRFRSGCMVCGREISYLAEEKKAACYYCGGVRQINALCAQGHYICDDCHQRDGLNAIRVICGESREEDMLALLARIRSHRAIPMHGPEHHALVPGIILATFRNRGGRLSKEAVLAGIERGSKVPGGVCGFWGSCGAAIGVGIAFSVLLEATPLTPAQRQRAQEVTSTVLAAVARIRGARCCQRETVTALREAARLSRTILPVALLAEADFVCRQSAGNRECIGGLCSLWPGERQSHA